MYFRIKLLCETLNQYKKIIIYGAGNFAREIYLQLNNCDLKKKIVCFAQTKKAELENIEDIPVMEIGEITCNRKECVVLIAVNELYVNEIKQILLNYGYLNIVSLCDYRVSYKMTEEAFGRLSTFDEYCEQIADWHVKTHIGSSDKEIILTGLKNRGRYVNEKKELKLIVMICGHLSPRTIKIIRALKQKQYTVIMLSYCLEENKWCIDELNKLNIDICRCSCIEEMLYKALSYCPLVYYIEPRWGDCLWPEILFRNKKYFGKMVLGLYDILNDGYTGQPENKLETEKKALKNADGIVWRWFSKEYLEQKGLVFQGKSIQFLDYCSYQDDRIVPQNNSSSALKLCAITGYGDEYVEERKFTSKYTVWAIVSEILAVIGNRKDCIFHFYAGGFLDDRNIECLEEYEKKYNNFRFYINTEYGKLLKRLKDYDFGCEFTINKEEAPDEFPMGDYYGSICRNSIRNAYFDFLEAGLPVITTWSSKMWEYLSPYKIVIKMDLSNLDIDYLKKNRNYYKQEVRKAQKELDINNQIIRLIHFFKEI